jgi:hypothetical protein
MGHQLNQKAFFQNDCGVVMREKCKIVWSWDDVVSKDMQETLWGFIKE